MADHHPQSRKSVNAPQRLLLIRPSALGDVCRTVPVLVSLRKAFPTAQIDWLVQVPFAPAVANHPDLHAVVDFDRKRFSKLLIRPDRWGSFRAFTGQLRESRYDMVFDLQGLARAGFFSWATRAPVRVGFANAREGGHLGYTHRYHVDANLHTVDRMLGLLDAHGIRPEVDMRLFTPANDLAWADDYLKEIGVGKQPFALLAPTAQWLCKCWPIDRFVKLAKRLQDEKNLPVVVIAAPHEQAIVQPLLDALDTSLPQTTIGRMMGLIQRSALMVCHDSGPLHMAVGLGTPTVSLFGPTDPAKVGPYQQNQWVVQPENLTAEELKQSYRARKDDQSIMRRITEEQVWDRVQQRLEL